MTAPPLPRTLILDYYDSYTNNLLSLFTQLYTDAEVLEKVVVVKADRFSWNECQRSVLPSIDCIILSPGPGRPDNPSDIGFALDLIRLHPVPILGVCLGHQAIAVACGGKIINTPHITHGHVVHIVPVSPSKGLFASPNKLASTTEQSNRFPRKEYARILVHLTFILSISFLVLPRLQTWISDSAQAPITANQRSSADRPEHRFLMALTARPLATMLWDVLGSLIIMIWWGRRMSALWRPSGQRRRLLPEVKDSERERRTVSCVTEAALATVAAAMCSSLLLMCFGAPMNSYIQRTFLFALHLSILLVWPVVFVLGVSSIFDTRVYERYRSLKILCHLQADAPMRRALVYPVIGAVCGAWLGAVPNSIHWDRPWQSYPLTPTIGSILGFLVVGYVSLASSSFDARIRNIQHEPDGRSEPSSSSSKKGSFDVVVYNSLTVDPSSLPDELEVTAWSAPSPIHDRTIQGLAHKHFPIWGVQFHPESISSTHGSTLLNTFIDRVHTHHGSPTAFPPLAKIVKDACASRIASSPSKPQRSIVSGSSAPLQQRGEPSTRLRLVEKRFGELGRDLRTQDVFQTVVRSHKGKEKAVGEVWLDGQTPTRSTTSSLAAPSFLLTYSLSSRTIRFHRPCSTTAKLVLQDDETFWDWFASGQTALSARAVDPGGNGNQGWKGGWVGWFSYEMKEESLQGYGRKPRTPDREDEVDACWAWADRVLERAQEGEWIARGVIRDSSNEDQDWSNGRSAGTETLVDWLTRLGVSLGLKFADFNTYVADIESHLSSPIDSPEPASSFPSLKPISDSESYRHRIDACRQFIRQGESYELTLTTSFTGHDPTGADPFALYLRMRSSNPAYYSTYMSFACLDLHVLSTSPERFLRIDGKREIEMMPIKGTRARVKPGQCVCLPGRCDDGKACTEEAMVEDWRIGEALQSDTKERAENLMVTILPPVEVGGETEQIVDLIRSDLLSCCIPSTVTVPRLIELESYGVHNLVSTIRGTLAPNVGSVEAVKRCFPPGSMTGAPKLRSVQLLDELESQRRRGIYSGALGYFSVDGTDDLSVVIRTIVIERNSISLGAGGAVTWLSDRDKEWSEVLTKVRSVVGEVEADR